MKNDRVASGRRVRRLVHCFFYASRLRLPPPGSVGSSGATISLLIFISNDLSFLCDPSKKIKTIDVLDALTLGLFKNYC